MSLDTFDLSKKTQESPAADAAAVTLSDSVDLGFITRGLYVGNGGDVKVTMKGGQAVVFTAVTGGTLLPIRVKRVWNTGTTASNLVGVW